MEQIGVRVSAELKGYFERLAEEQRRTFSDVIRMALEDAASGSHPDAYEGLERIETLIKQMRPVTLQQLRAELRSLRVTASPEEVGDSDDDGLDFSSFEL